ncbi:hypothetical protein HELRODRAFT_193792 [Helobdella robusta]|uniref:FERM domain-containing protein n=1 Tax=Helobdella robusta TaxID=6412 RepID=T1FVC9_HELRO|nr:hypothetical protein HELRODRAFT_193792 [Helobdella robusta]ESN94803.1 hypothetical protein HELRODRAFT_193792 [Helobdella robusta]
MLVALSKIIPKVFNKKRADPKSGSCPVEDVLNHTCRVIMLDNSDLFLNFKLTEKAENLMNIICGKIDLVEREYFGLRYSDSVCNLRWLNLSKSLNSQLPGPGPHSIFFCVRFYAVDPCKLVTPEAKYQFYLQIKRDILHGGIHLTRDLAIQLSAYAIQAEYGDNQSEVLDDDEFMDFLFIREDSEEYRKEVQEWQKNVSGRSPTKCEFQFLDKVKWVESYGLQMYPVKSQDDLDYTIGIAPVGLYLFKKEIKMAVYCWPRLTKISYKNKTVAFKVRDRYGDEMTNSFILPSKNHAKLLWTHMLEHHTFFMLQARENVQSSTMLTVTSLANFKQQQQQQQHKHSRSFSASSNSSRFLSFGSKLFSKKDKKDCHNCLQPHLNSSIRQQKKCCCSDDSSLRNFLNRSLVPDLVSGSRFNEVTKTRAGLRQRRQSGSNSFHDRDIPMARPSSCATIAPIVRDPADYDQVAAAEVVGDSPRSCRSSSIRWDARVLQQMRDGRNRMGSVSNSHRNNLRVGREEFRSDSGSGIVRLKWPNY